MTQATKNISGFPEFLPEEQIEFNRIVALIAQQFELYGFVPLDTPAVERTTTLLAKGNDSEIYGVHRLADSGNSSGDLALRFDLTVPLARYVAQHYGKLTFPYRRYHIAPVWRGERPQAGRHRQFYQCDIDIINNDTLDLVYDAEILLILCNVFKAIGLGGRFVIKINNRNILTGLVKSFGITDDVKVASIVRIIDKAAKITQDNLKAELLSQDLTSANIDLIINLLLKSMTNTQWLEYLSTLCSHEEFLTGLEELKYVFTSTKSFGIASSSIRIDPSLARGLNYYTGTVFETILFDYPKLGSVCGGGRYANLVDTFSAHNRKLPGVGLSIGISRLFSAMVHSGIINTKRQTPASVLITIQDFAFAKEHMHIADNLRNAGIKTEVYLAQAQLSTQMKYANQKGFDFVIIIDSNKINVDQLILRNMNSGEQTTGTMTEIINIIISKLNPAVINIETIK